MGQRQMNFILLILDKDLPHISPDLLHILFSFVKLPEEVVRG